MQETIDSTEYRRTKQINYNTENNITPTQVQKAKKKIIEMSGAAQQQADLVAEPTEDYGSKEGLEKAIERTKKAMQKASKELDFILAAQLRDKMYELQARLKK